VSPLRDPLGFDGSPKPPGGNGGQLLLRRLMPGFELWWTWRQSRRAAQHPASAAAKQEDRLHEREPDGQ
jgi:hypothetical protein